MKIKGYANIIWKYFITQQSFYMGDDEKSGCRFQNQK